MPGVRVEIPGMQNLPGRGGFALPLAEAYGETGRRAVAKAAMTSPTRSFIDPKEESPTVAHRD